MKNYYKNFYAIITIVLMVVFSGASYSQCSLTYYAGIGAPTSGTAYATWSNYGPGQYFAFPFLNGGSYDISTCGASIDTQLTGWDPVATSVVFYNDDNGPLCSGTNASIGSYIPNFTNYAYVQVCEFNCSPGGSASINVYLRQNDNLNFTSSGANMCVNDTRTLTATPANVGSSPGGYGDPGTFSGIGVSGGIFTAPNVTTSTNYTITYTFGYVSHSQVIIVNPLPVVTASAIQPTLCTGGTTAVNASGASTYTWTGGVVNGVAFSPTASANYTVTGTSAAGCTNTAFTTVTVNPAFTITVNSGSICAGDSFTITPSGAVNYTYISGSAVVTPTATSSYIIIGDDGQGCTNGAMSSVTVNPTPIINVNSGSICLGDSFTLVPSGGSTYTYSSGQAVVTPTVASTYSVTGSNAFGCTADANSFVNINATPIITASDGGICPGNSFTITPSGASNYTFSSGSDVVSPATTTSYSVSGSSSGCEGNTVVITVSVQPSLTVNIVGSNTVCSGQPIILTATGGTSYSWNNGASTSVIAPEPLTNTVYSVTGTGSLCPAEASISINVLAKPTVIAVASSTLICSGSTVVLSGSGADFYGWTNGAVDGVAFSPSVSAVYSVNGLDITSGCSATASIAVNVNPLPIVHATDTHSIICAGEQSTLNASGAATYSWNTGATGNAILVSPTITTSYTLSGTDANGCMNTAFITQSVSQCTDIKNVSEQNEIHVYPNPNSGNFIIELNETTQITITNAIGQIIFDQPLDQGHQSLNISEQPNGIYFVRMTGSRHQQVIKIIKE